MSEIELFPFQATASEAIATRFAELIRDERRPSVNRFWDVPFYQALSALTGAGKTPVLADAVAQMRGQLPIEPIVLWISKAKAVVNQTFTNFQAGGKYEHFIEGFLVTYLSDMKPDMIKDRHTPYLALATAGTFNRDPRGGTLKVHQQSEDSFGGTPWSILKERRTSDGYRRPLIIVYDEGHNLSDQQTDLLVDLEPDAILVASATMKTSASLGRLLERLREYGWDQDKLVTSVPSKAIVDAGLVKRQIVLGGYATIMEAALDDMIMAYNDATSKAKAINAGFLPKAMYVCRTNISQEDGSTDNFARPFKERKAPPILIWRYLVERKKISPSQIAVYCDLKFDRKGFPPPDNFLLFSGGDEDFSVFTQGNYRHIIFNLSLQEGWDDPACCFAYIDKSMGSPLQVEQVIGRVLRQPGGKHYSDPDLNSAHFYIRVDSKQVFPQIIETVRKKLAADIPEVRLTAYENRRQRNKVRADPKQLCTVPEIHIDSTNAVDALREEIANIHDYRDSTSNTIGKGELIRVVQKIGDPSNPKVHIKALAHSNRVMVRWILRRSIQALYPEVIKSIDWSDPRFDATVEITSPAHGALKTSADRLVDIFLDLSDLTFERENQYTVGPVLLDSSVKPYSFKRAVHKAYTDLNSTELGFAQAIDHLDPPVIWARNPSNGGFSIPLLEKGTSRRFFPDFLVWTGKLIFALDPKGDQLIAKDAGRKLLDISDEKGARRIIVRLMSKGKWRDPTSQLGAEGYTVWGLRSGKIVGRHCNTVEDAITIALRP